MALTIIEAASVTRLTTIEAVKAELQVTGGADDAHLATLIDQASDAVRSWCKRTFATETVRETIHADRPAKSHMLARWPVGTITSMAINGAGEDVSDVEAEDSGQLFRLDGYGCRTSWPPGRIVVEYNAGYILPGQPGRTLPNDIERAAILLVKSAYFARNRDPLIKTETVEGIGSTSYGFAGLDRGFSLPPEVEALLSRYRAVSVL